MNARAEAGTRIRSLLADGSAVVETDPSCWPYVEPWIPLHCAELESDAAARATLTVAPLPARTSPPDPAGDATVRVGDSIDLRGPTGELYVDLDDHERARGDVYSMLTVASALVLGRLGCVLIHAGAVIARDGRSWLVVGDARSGKSTTCVSLAACGLDLLSDDQVVLRADGDDVQVEGWLRPVHLDDGWDRKIPVGERRTIHPSALGRWEDIRVAPVAGTIHTAVEPDTPTHVTDLSAADAFARLVRQSPWLLADRGVASAVVATLTRVAGLPRHVLHLGRDTFGRPERLRATLPAIRF
ncbi:MAG: hypothetical protein AMS20_17580 [Gemmatimonas sp. SG8_28]|nr:MAG: hypothetical protein AMS20_17580 [Gemmatimonas sp. SG8_28]